MPAQNDKPEEKKSDKPDAAAPKVAEDKLASIRPVGYIPASSLLSETVPGGAVWRLGRLVNSEGIELESDRQGDLIELVQKNKG